MTDRPPGEPQWPKPGHEVAPGWRVADRPPVSGEPQSISLDLAERIIRAHWPDTWRQRQNYAQHHCERCGWLDGPGTGSKWETPMDHVVRAMRENLSLVTDRPPVSGEPPARDFDDPALYPFDGMKPQCGYVVHWAHCRLDAKHEGMHSPGRIPAEAVRAALERLIHYADAASDCGYDEHHSCDHRPILRDEVEKARRVLSENRND